MNGRKKDHSSFNLFESTEYKSFTSKMDNLNLKEGNKQDQISQYLLNLRSYSEQRGRFKPSSSSHEQFLNRSLMFFEEKETQEPFMTSTEFLKATYVRSKDSLPVTIKMTTFKKY